MTDDLVTRLLAAITEREQAAREAQAGPWHIGNAVDPTRQCNVHTFPGARGVASEVGWLDAEHIVWHDPASVLRLCQAHRDIVAKRNEAADYLKQLLDSRAHGATVMAVGGALRAWDEALRIVAGGYGIQEEL